ncbi:hypothetical protein IV203_017336 [Nitzschia inconspicua]|uniref:Uncharacterized protein n=1 Tax=Nitzschia inconspicua TaxID=303405 RepID=A0A9K3KSC2_9STRA|nr:hypothetical protein IV203_017336 [Nitzschia inconspicua]
MQETIAIEGVDECDWEGIVWVEEIVFPFQGLTGHVANEIHLLRNSLRVLDLAGNSLQGTLPDGLYELTLLEKLFLYDNDLTGTLSSGIGNWNRLTTLQSYFGAYPRRIEKSRRSPSIAIPQLVRQPVD